MNTDNTKLKAQLNSGETIHQWNSELYEKINLRLVSSLPIYNINSLPSTFHFGSLAELVLLANFHTKHYDEIVPGTKNIFD